MGIILRQSLSNTLITYLGFGIAAINTLFLYTRFLTDEYYGLVTVILSTSAILMPLLAFGVPNTLVKFYSTFSERQDSDGFLSLMLLLPLLFIVPLALISFLSLDAIAHFLSRKNPIVKGYVWYIFLIGLAMAYFEIFYAWSKVHMKSVFGNFMKEVFNRIGVMVLLTLIYLELISVDFFLKALVALYLLRTVIMKLYAYHIRMPNFTVRIPPNTMNMISYSALIILGGSAAIVILEIDKFMINQFIQIQNVAYYGVAVYIATTIIVPSRSMHQITYPITAELMTKNDIPALKTLYQKSSLTLFIISGLLFLLIILNLNDLYLLLPEEYRNGFIIVFFVGLGKVYDSILGNNNSILYNSEYYRSLLVMGVLLAVLIVIFNMWLIPNYGIEGAAAGTFFAIFLYNTIKLLYVKSKFDIQPFTWGSLKVLLLLVLMGVTFYAVPFPFHPIGNILLKSLLIVVIYTLLLYRLRWSEDVVGLISKVVGKKRK